GLQPVVRTGMHGLRDRVQRRVEGGVGRVETDGFLHGLDRKLEAVEIPGDGFLRRLENADFNQFRSWGEKHLEPLADGRHQLAHHGRLAAARVRRSEATPLVTSDGRAIGHRRRRARLVSASITASPQGKRHARTPRASAIARASASEASPAGLSHSLWFLFSYSASALLVRRPGRRADGAPPWPAGAAPENEPSPVDARRDARETRRPFADRRFGPPSLSVVQSTGRGGATAGRRAA